MQVGTRMHDSMRRGPMGGLRVTVPQLGDALGALPSVHHHDLVDADVQDRLTFGTKAVAVSTNKLLTSKFRGVCWNKNNKKWQAAINSSGKYLHLGSYDTEEQATRAFDRAAIRIRGKKAKLNFRYEDYVTSDGKVIPDAFIDRLLQDASNPTSSHKRRRMHNRLRQAEAEAGGGGGGGGNDDDHNVAHGAGGNDGASSGGEGGEGGGGVSSGGAGGVDGGADGRLSGVFDAIAVGTVPVGGSFGCSILPTQHNVPYNPAATIAAQRAANYGRHPFAMVARGPAGQGGGPGGTGGGAVTPRPSDLPSSAPKLEPRWDVNNPQRSAALLELARLCDQQRQLTGQTTPRSAQQQQGAYEGMSGGGGIIRQGGVTHPPTGGEASTGMQASGMMAAGSSAVPSRLAYPPQLVVPQAAAYPGPHSLSRDPHNSVELDLASSGRGAAAAGLLTFNTGGGWRESKNGQFGQDFASALPPQSSTLGSNLTAAQAGQVIAQLMPTAIRAAAPPTPSAAGASAPVLTPRVAAEGGHTACELSWRDVMSRIRASLPGGVKLVSLVPGETDSVLGVLYRVPLPTAAAAAAADLSEVDRVSFGLWHFERLLFREMGVYGSLHDAHQACATTLHRVSEMGSGAGGSSALPSPAAHRDGGGAAGWPGQVSPYEASTVWQTAGQLANLPQPSPRMREAAEVLRTVPFGGASIRQDVVHGSQQPADGWTAVTAANRHLAMGMAAPHKRRAAGAVAAAAGLPSPVALSTDNVVAFPGVPSSIVSGDWKLYGANQLVPSNAGGAVGGDRWDATAGHAGDTHHSLTDAAVEALTGSLIQPDPASAAPGVAPLQPDPPSPGDGSAPSPVGGAAAAGSGIVLQAGHAWEGPAQGDHSTASNIPSGAGWQQPYGSGAPVAVPTSRKAMEESSLQPALADMDVQHAVTLIQEAQRHHANVPPAAAAAAGETAGNALAAATATPPSAGASTAAVALQPDPLEADALGGGDGLQTRSGSVCSLADAAYCNGARGGGGGSEPLAWVQERQRTWQAAAECGAAVPAHKRLSDGGAALAAMTTTPSTDLGGMDLHQAVMLVHAAQQQRKQGVAGDQQQQQPSQ